MTPYARLILEALIASGVILVVATLAVWAWDRVVRGR